jgi:hypothetical protein
MFQAILFCTLGAQLVLVATLKATRTLGSFWRTTAGSAAAGATAFSLLLVAARIHAGQPFNAVGPEYGILVSLCGFFVGAANSLLSLLVSPLFLRRL